MVNNRWRFCFLQDAHNCDCHGAVHEAADDAAVKSLYCRIAHEPAFGFELENKPAVQGVMQLDTELLRVRNCVDCGLGDQDCSPFMAAIAASIKLVEPGVRMNLATALAKIPDESEAVEVR